MSDDDDDDDYTSIVVNDKGEEEDNDNKSNELEANVHNSLICAQMSNKRKSHL